MKKESKTDIWEPIIQELLSTFKDGSVIPHEWFKKKFGVSSDDDMDGLSVSEMKKIWQSQQFQMLNFMEILKERLLTEHGTCLRSISGDGYMIVLPEQQVRYGYDKAVSDIKKTLNKSERIMWNVRPVSSKQQAEDNDIRARFSIMKQAFENSIKNKSNT